MPHSQGLSNNPYPGRINPNPRIDTYFSLKYISMAYHITIICVFLWLPENKYLHL
jgi:hypothetical protein